MCRRGAGSVCVCRRARVRAGARRVRVRCACAGARSVAWQARCRVVKAWQAGACRARQGRRCGAQVVAVKGGNWLAHVRPTRSQVARWYGRQRQRGMIVKYAPPVRYRRQAAERRAVNGVSSDGALLRHASSYVVIWQRDCEQRQYAKAGG